MSTPNPVTALQPRLEENFLFDTYLFLDSRIQGLCANVMLRASEIAASKALCNSPTMREYRVERSHVDEALREVLSDPVRSQRGVGFDA
jgi:hypothetical protein